MTTVGNRFIGFISLIGFGQIPLVANDAEENRVDVSLCLKPNQTNRTNQTNETGGATVFLDSLNPPW
jgi:hypothetical protein